MCLVKGLKCRKENADEKPCVSDTSRRYVDYYCPCIKHLISCFLDSLVKSLQVPLEIL